MAKKASSGARSVERETMVNGTRRKHDCAAGPVLPDDLVLWEIFYRLPAKEILRCRAACRSWRRLTCDAEFLLAHHHRQPSVPLVSFLPRINTNASVNAFYLRQTPAVSRPILGFNDYTERRSFTVHASCDGLLLLSLGNGRFYICNPATRQWLALPALSGGNVAALYPHRPSGEYRVLYWNLPNKNTSNSSAVYYVLTVGFSEGQRCIGLPVASPSMTSDTTCWLIRACEHPPALLHDCLYWYVNSKVVVFDTLVESFRWMESPVATYSAHLLQMDGTLGIGHRDRKISQVWVLQDYETEIWSSKYRGQLPASTFSFKVVSENGDMLGTNGPNLPSSSSLFHCHSNGKVLRKFRRQNANPRILGLCFKESLVRHEFFKRKDGRLPRFFRGL